MTPDERQARLEEIRRYDHERVLFLKGYYSSASPEKVEADFYWLVSEVERLERENKIITSALYERVEAYTRLVQGQVQVLELLRKLRDRVAGAIGMKSVPQEIVEAIRILEGQE